MPKAVSPREPRVAAVDDREAAFFVDLLALAQAAADSGAFLDQAARALVERFHLDRGLVLLRDGRRWEITARFGRLGESGPEFDYDLLERLEEEGRILWQNAAGGPANAVAIPILDPRRQVIAALYGTGVRGTIPVSQADFQADPRLTLLASLVGLGLLRQEKEAEVKRLRAQLEQLLSSKLAWELQRNPALLETQEQEVTVLFCDIGDFAPMAERLGPKTSCRLVSEVMDRVTARVGEFDGSVVDYYGDGMLAMWNAPAVQADHAARASRAALAIQTEVPRLSLAWAEILGAPLKLRCTLNSGPALVGNTGSRLRVKYGPIGHTVNLAHRVQAAGKYFALPILLTGATRPLIDGAFALRRLCRAHLPGMRSDVALFELHGETAAAAWLARRDAYEQALAMFEAGQWSAACRALHPWLDASEGQPDLACLQLAGRAIDCLKMPPEKFNPVWNLEGK